MSAPLPPDSERTQRSAALPDGLQVFHRQDAVGLLQGGQLFPEQLLRQCLTGGRKAAVRVLLHPLTDLLVKVGTAEKRRQFLQFLRIVGFGPEGDGIGLQRLHQADRAGGKALGRSQRPGQRQLHDQVGPRPAGRLRTGEFGEHRRFAALHEIAAHDGGKYRILPEHAAAGGQLAGMPAVKGIVFGCNSYGFHGRTPKKDLRFYLKLIRIGRKSKRPGTLFVNVERKDNKNENSCD